MLGRVNESAPGNYPLFTAATGVVTVIRDISVVSTDAGVPLVGYLLVNGVGYQSLNAPAGPSAFHLECRMVLVAGDVVSFDIAGGYGACYVSGYVLD